jgi:hypothetical protein
MEAFATTAAALLLQKAASAVVGSHSNDYENVFQ